MTTHFPAVPGGRTPEKDTGGRTARAQGTEPTPHPAYGAHDAQGTAVGGGAR